jgi:tetratricopeptide (TPR) repeat protein
MNRFRDDAAAPPVEPPPAPAAHPPMPAHSSGMRRRPPHEPIVPAYHPSATERLGTAFRARKREIFAIVALVLALALGVVGTTIGMVRAARQRDAAERARAEADRLRGAAEARGRDAAAVADFHETVFGSLNPWGADRASEVSVEQFLDVAAAKLDAGTLSGQKEGEARIRATLGHGYAGLSLPARAEKQLRRALDIRRELSGRRDDAEVARLMNALSSVLLSLGPAHVQEAEQLATAALDMRRRVYGPDHKEVADSLDQVSAVARVRRDYYTAERRVDEAIAMRRRHPDDPKARTGLASSLTNRAILSWRKGELTATIRDLREAMDNYRGEIPGDHLLLGVLHSRLGAAYAADGHWADAMREFRQSVDVRRRHRPESHGDITEPFRRLVVITWEQGDFDGAQALLTERESRLRAIPNCPAEPLTEVYGQFVGLYQAWGKPEQAAPWSGKFRDSIGREIAEASAVVEKDPSRAKGYFDRAKLYVRAGQFREASADYQRGIQIDPTDHWPWYYEGCLLAYLDDEPAYRRHCADMLQRFGASSDGHILDCTVKTCSLLPNGAGGEPARLNQMANQVWALGAKDERNVTWFRLLKGMAEYRAGNAEPATNWLTATLQPVLPHRTATVELYLAMACRKLGKTDQARAALASAEQRVAQSTPKPGVGDLAEGGIENWLICQTALREARSTVSK